MSNPPPDAEAVAKLVAKIHLRQQEWGSHADFMRDCLRCRWLSDALTTFAAEQVAQAKRETWEAAAKMIESHCERWKMERTLCNTPSANDKAICPECSHAEKFRRRAQGGQDA